ncbi:MAG: EI24 domain-containing protein, partial [Planctomycetota bacterium]
MLLLALPALGSFALLSAAIAALWRWGAGHWRRWEEQPPDFGDGPWAERAEALLGAAAESSWTSGLAGVLAAALLLIFGWYLFALAFEVVLGPFLDELHARVERRRYGREDIERLGRPPALSTAQVTRRSSIAGALAIALALGGWLLVSPQVGLLLAPAPFFAASLLQPEYGRWLVWALGVESRLLIVGLAIATFALFLVVLLLPLTLLQVVGVPLYALGVGFGTALSLLDLPAARRGWSVGLRWRFAWAHALPLALFGALSG